MVIRNNTQTLTHTQIEKKERKEGKGREKWKKKKLLEGFRRSRGVDVKEM